MRMFHGTSSGDTSNHMMFGRVWKWKYNANIVFRKQTQLLEHFQLHLCGNSRTSRKYGDDRAHNRTKAIGDWWQTSSKSLAWNCVFVKTQAWRVCSFVPCGNSLHVDSSHICRSHHHPEIITTLHSRPLRIVAKYFCARLGNQCIC